MTDWDIRPSVYILIFPLAELYEFDHDQQSVFYRIQKQRLEANVQGDATARKIIQRIKDAPASRLGYIGAMLYKIQNGEVKVREPPEKDEWQGILEVCNRKKFLLKG